MTLFPVRLRLIVTALALALGGAAGDAAAQWWTDHPAESYCNAAHETDSNRERCLEDQRHAAGRIHAYGTAKGQLTQDGGLTRTRLLRDHAGMRAVPGLPPREAYPICLDDIESLNPGNGAKPFEGTYDPAETGIFGPFDMTALWACIAREDPEAARFETP